MTEDKSFAELFDQSFEEPKQLKPGQKVEATIVRIAKEWIFIDLGGKSEGSLAKNELLDEEGNLTVNEGDTVQAYFLSAKNNENLFTTKIGGGATNAHLEEAYHGGIPVEGKVVKEIKGGFEVKIGGTTRAFCPFSQMDLRRVDDNEEYIDQQFSFKISEYGESGRNIIVSRRAILEEEREQLKEALRETLVEGVTVKGTITSIRDFGAFVDIGGIEGLLPISEIAWGQIEDIHERLHVGQQVEVAVMKLDWDKDRFSFSLKETLPDPWDTVAVKYQEGSFYSGKVVRLVEFGAFVSLEPGIDGLVHISKLGAGRRINHPREIVTQGQSIDVRVDSVDMEKHRLSLSIPEPDKEEKPGKKGKPSKRDESKHEDYKQYVAGQGKESAKSLGTLGDLLKGKLGEK